MVKSLFFSPNKALIQAVDEIYRIRSHLLAHKVFQSRSRQSNSDESIKDRSRERYERDRESGETDTDEETLEGTCFLACLYENTDKAIAVTTVLVSASVLVNGFG